MNFAAVMDGIAAVVTAAAEAPGSDLEALRVYDRPSSKVSLPCFIVGGPEGDIDLNATYTGAHSRAEFHCWWVIGARTERTSFDDLSAKLQPLADAIHADPTLDGAAQSALVRSAALEAATVSGVEALAVRFVIDVFA